MMQPFHTHNGLVAAINRSNIDTDTILPKRFSRLLHRKGLGQYCFDVWRYLDHACPCDEISERPINHDFVLNKLEYREASILLVRENFGCGSSREHALWALVDYGFRVVIAESFADLFYQNSVKNGLLPIVLPKLEVDKMFQYALECPLCLSIDLQKQRVYRDDGVFCNFDIDAFSKYCLERGLDDIALTLQYTEEIKAFEKAHRNRFPWLFGL